MKRSSSKSTSLFKAIVALFLLAGIASSASGQAVNEEHDAIIRPVAPYTSSVFIDRTGSNNSWNGGSGTYVWSIQTTPTGYSGGVSFGPYTQSGGSAGDVTVTFTAAAVPGRYNFRLTRGSTFRDADIIVGNLGAANSSNPITAFAVNPSNNGNLIVPNPDDIFDPNTNTAALGIDIEGHFYFMPNNNPNNGNVVLYGTEVNGENRTTIDATVDLNGTSNNSLGFVRLAIDPASVGWMLAGDGSTVYVASFPANGTAPTNVSAASSVTITGGGNAAVFQNGDLCFSANGTMFALANNGSGTTYIYVAAPPYTTFVRKWTLVGPGGVPFTGSVNGVAFDILGSLYISTSTGLYYIDQNTVNTFGTGTVICAVRWTGTGLTDLCSNAFPEQTTLPVKWGAFSVTKQAGIALLKWTTLNEVNNEHFDIERSIDGVNFNKVGSVAGNGSSSVTNNYQYTDALTGITAKMIYYRIKDVGYDGKSSLSKIVALRLDGTGGPRNLTIYPNPFLTNIKVSMHSDAQQMVTIRITNMAGQQLVNRIATLQQGENIIVIGELEKLKTGVHILEIISGDEKIIQKIIKN